MIEEIKKNLSINIKCNHLKIIDESPNHGGYDGSISHVKLIVVSKDFDGLNLIKRHQLVYKALGELVSKIHAISIVSKTFDEWKKSADFIPSPDCAKNK
jgi:BolA protein